MQSNANCYQERSQGQHGAVGIDWAPLEGDSQQAVGGRKDNSAIGTDWKQQELGW